MTIIKYYKMVNEKMWRTTIATIMTLAVLVTGTKSLQPENVTEFMELTQITINSAERGNPPNQTLPLSPLTTKHRNSSFLREKNVPYLVKVTSVYVCSGVIIHELWVITAAQCFGSSTSAQIYWGNEVMKSRAIFIHPLYVSVLEPGNVIVGSNDLALIQLPVGIRFSKDVKKVALDGREWPQDNRIYKRSCMGAGIGRHKTLQRFQSNVHRRLFSAEHGEEACACIPENLKHSLVCMRGDHSFCAEDLGGPLVCDKKLVAILHTLYNLEHCNDKEIKVAAECDKPNTMSVCTFLCPYLNWIRHYVPTVPPKPASCRSKPRATSSLVTLTYFTIPVIIISFN